MVKLTISNTPFCNTRFVLTHWQFYKYLESQLFLNGKPFINGRSSTSKTRVSQTKCRQIIPTTGSPRVPVGVVLEFFFLPKCFSMTYERKKFLIKFLMVSPAWVTCENHNFFVEHRHWIFTAGPWQSALRRVPFLKLRQFGDSDFDAEHGLFLASLGIFRSRPGDTLARPGVLR